MLDSSFPFPYCPEPVLLVHLFSESAATAFLVPLRASATHVLAQTLTLDELEPILIVWTIRLSLAFMFVAFACRLFDIRLRNRRTLELEQMDANLEPPKENSFADGAKHAWLLGSFFSLLHAFATMLIVHQGSHELAFEHTAEQTQTLLGFSVGLGIYFNYVFVVVWLLDAMWWIAGPKSYDQRAAFFNWIVYGYLIFIAINGAIIFESGIVRWVSMGAFAVLALMAFIIYKQKPAVKE